MITETHFALQSEIEITREKFHRLLVTIPENSLQLPSKLPAQTNGEVLYRIGISPLYIRSLLRRNLGGWTHSVLPKLVTGTLVDWDNEKSMRSATRDLTRLSLAKEYEYNCKLLLDMLDALSESDFMRTVVLAKPDPLLNREATVEQLFHYVKDYFNFHRRDLELEK
jgi:hypothetical protein